MVGGMGVLVGGGEGSGLDRNVTKGKEKMRVLWEEETGGGGMAAGMALFVMEVGEWAEGAWERWIGGTAGEAEVGVGGGDEL